MFNKFTTLLCGVTAVLFIGCSKEDQTPVSVKKPPVQDVIKELHVAGEVVGKMTESQEFKELVYTEIAKKFDGDDNVLLEKLLDNTIYFKSGKVNAEQKQALKDIVDGLSSVKNRKFYPQVYIPYFKELQERRMNATTGANLRVAEEPIVYVIWDGHETKNDEYPGYVMNSTGKLEKLAQMITKEYAQQHEVWVLSYNERMEQNILTSQQTSPNGKVRVAGAAEYMEWIQIQDLGWAEGWPAGAVELKLTVATAKSKVLDGLLPSISRDRVKDKRWFYMHRFLFYWHLDHGKIINIHWIEVDDGGNNPTTIAMKIPAQNGLPEMSFSTTIDDNDEDMGEQLVHFDDPDPTHVEYDSGQMKWFMESY